MSSDSAVDKFHLSQSGSIPSVAPSGRKALSGRSRMFSAAFWGYTVASIVWLAIGLVPGLFAGADVTFRQVVDVFPNAFWLRRLAMGVYAASMTAQPLPAVVVQYAFSFLNIALGVLLYRSRPADWVARLLALGMVGTAAIFNYQAHSTLELMGPFVNTLHEFLHVFSGSMYLIALLLFPNGKLPPWPIRSWSPPADAGRVVGPLALAGLVAFGYLLTIVLHGEPASFVAFYGVVIPVVGMGAQAFRYRSTLGQERQLSKTLILALALSFALSLVLGVGAWLVSETSFNLSWQMRDALNRLAFVVFPLLFALLPLSLTAIVLRHRLWEIDLAINRSLVYGGLTVAILLLYALGAGAFGLLLGSQYGVAVAVATTIAVAGLAQPIRVWLQRGVNRLMYGERDDPVAVLTQLGHRLETTLPPEEVLPAVAETVAQALRLPYVAIAVQGGDGLRVLAEYPTRPTSWPEGAGVRQSGTAVRLEAPDARSTSPALAFPLTSQGAVVGEMIVAPRAAGEAFSAADRRLLASIAQRAGAAVEMVHLAAELRHSRERLVMMREEERRRLRRDLHDGLGPQLATLTLQLDAARNTLAKDPAQVDRLLSEIKAQTQAAIAGVRRLVYDLRPPALDQLGLGGALQEDAARITSDSLAVEIHFPETLRPLPAAVEVAAYRIATEALTNVVRHAQARRTTVWLCLDDDALYIAVDDDGRGLPAGYRPGVGLASMRERAEELGGACRIEPRPEGGTRVIARLPASG